MKIKEIASKLLNDPKSASTIEYMFSKAVSECQTGNLSFIYKNYKVVKDRRKFYAIYDMKSKIKIYNHIKYQDLAKFIIDNINDDYLIQNILNMENNVSRLKDRIEFMKLQLKNSNRKEIIEDKISMTYGLYNIAKRDFLNALGKRSIC